MLVYRIGSATYPIFDGSGAARIGGRWNKKGQRIIYCAESVALCQLELLAHIGRNSNVPKNHVICKIDIPDDMPVDTLDRLALPKGWDDPFDYKICQNIGARWSLDPNGAPVLRVPSVVSPDDFCVLINQNHADFRFITASAATPLVWDERLFR